MQYHVRVDRIVWIQICLAGVKFDAHSKNTYTIFLSSLLNVQV